MKRINVTQSSMPSFEEYVREIQPIFDAKYLTNMGPLHEKLQNQLKEYLQVPELSLFVNGHMSLEMALQAFDFPAGSKVITTPYTFISTTHAIVRQNLVPVFCDIRSDNYTIDPALIKDLITEDTVAIMPVHVYGNICDVEGIQRIADKYGLKVLYDGAHAFGTSYKGTTVGNFGDMCMFSFHATKVFNTIEGGAVAFRKEKYRERFQGLKNFGLHGNDNATEIGGNAKMNEFEAAMGICNLRHIEEEIAKRKVVGKRYYERLSGVKGIKLIEIPADLKWNYAYFPVLFDGYSKNRDEVQAELAQENIFARKYFYPIVNRAACYVDQYGDANVPVAAHAAECVLTLPMYADLTIEDVDRICDIILQA